MPKVFHITPETKHFDLWKAVYDYIKYTGGLVLIRSASEELTINAEFIPTRPDTDPLWMTVVGGGQRMTPTAFGERLANEIRALALGDLQ